MNTHYCPALCSPLPHLGEESLTTSIHQGQVKPTRSPGQVVGFRRVLLPGDGKNLEEPSPGHTVPSLEPNDA